MLGIDFSKKEVQIYKDFGRGKHKLWSWHTIHYVYEKIRSHDGLLQTQIYVGILCSNKRHLHVKITC